MYGVGGLVLEMGRVDPQAKSLPFGDYMLLEEVGWIYMYIYEYVYI